MLLREQVADDAACRHVSLGANKRGLPVVVRRAVEARKLAPDRDLRLVVVADGESHQLVERHFLVTIGGKELGG